MTRVLLMLAATTAGAGIKLELGVRRRVRFPGAFPHRAAWRLGVNRSVLSELIVAASGATWVLILAAQLWL